MKKKIILICTLVVMCLCVFAISASATTVSYVLGTPYFDDGTPAYDSTTGMIESNMLTYYYDFSKYGYNITLFTYVTSSMPEYGYSIYTCDNIENFYNDIKLNVPEKYEDITQNNIFSFLCNHRGYCGDSTLYYYDCLINLYNIYENDILSKYDVGYSEGLTQGKIDGVTEFKTTEEYKSQYTNGYTAGITYFKTSDEYAETLELERQIGQAEGKNNYLGSEEYKAALNKEYNNGYDTASSELEQEQTKNSLAVILGSCGIFVLALLVVYFLMPRKKHKRR